MQLWEEADYGNKIIVTSNNELVYYEQTSDLHEVVAHGVALDIHRYLRDIETKNANNGTVDIGTFVHSVSAATTKGKEADERFRAIKAFSNGKETEVTTVVIEVACVQKFISHDGTGLLEKCERWVDENKVPVVVLVKLYGYGRDKAPGMLACLMDNTKHIYEAIGYRAIDIEDETYFDGLDGIEITRVGDPERQMVLKINGHLLLGVGADNPQEQLETLIEAYEANGDDDWINCRQKEAIQATLNWVKAQTEIDLRGLYVSFIQYYRQHQENKK